MGLGILFRIHMSIWANLLTPTKVGKSRSSTSRASKERIVLTFYARSAPSLALGLLDDSGEVGDSGARHARSVHHARMVRLIDDGSDVS